MMRVWVILKHSVKGRRTCSLYMGVVCLLIQLNTWNLVCCASCTFTVFTMDGCGTLTTVVINCAFSSVEQQDVHNFLLNNMTNGGILDLMMRYLKAVCQKFMEEWPRGLSAVVLDVYQTWRKHSSGLPNPLLRDCSNQHIRVNDKKTVVIVI